MLARSGTGHLPQRANNPTHTEPAVVDTAQVALDGPHWQPQLLAQHGDQAQQANTEPRAAHGQPVQSHRRGRPPMTNSTAAFKNTCAVTITGCGASSMTSRVRLTEPPASGTPHCGQIARAWLSCTAADARRRARLSSRLARGARSPFTDAVGRFVTRHPSGWHDAILKIADALLQPRDRRLLFHHQRDQRRMTVCHRVHTVQSKPHHPNCEQLPLALSRAEQPHMCDNLMRKCNSVELLGGSAAKAPSGYRRMGHILLPARAELPSCALYGSLSVQSIDAIDAEVWRSATRCGAPTISEWL